MQNLNRNGILGTTIFHLLIVFLLIFFGFSYPDPPPEEEGILINFGIDETGFGSIEPAGDDSQAGEEITEEISEEIVEETVVSQPVQQTVQEVVEEVVEDVQDFEESPVKENKPTPEEIRQKELEAQKKIEDERIRQEKLEQDRIEKERLRVEEEKRKQAEKIRQMGESAFGGNKGVGTGDGSEGITEGSGNQGSLSGQPGVDNYGDGGGLGDGISYGLGNRKVKGNLTADLSGCTLSSQIIIKVQIDVDSKGDVVSAKIEKSTFSDDCINKAILKAARNAKFTESDAYRQRGWIRYIIEP